MLRILALVLVATSVCHGEVGDIARGRIKSETKDEIVIETKPCEEDVRPMKFIFPWKKPKLIEKQKKCAKSDKYYDEYEVEQLAPPPPPPETPPADKAGTKPGTPDPGKGVVPPNGGGKVDTKGWGDKVKKKSGTP